MQGPTAATMRSRRAPSLSMAAMVASRMPASAPRQPACAAADDAGLGVGEQHRGAIGGQHADGEAARGRDDGVGPRPLVRRPRRSSTTRAAVPCT